MIRVLVAATIVVLAAPAHAQSQRYPAEPPDPDRDAELHSRLWEDALHPGRSPYQQLVREARVLAEERSTDATADALAKLDRAIALLPKAPDAYVVRGEIELRLARFDKCADDLAAAEEHAPADASAIDRAARRLELGVCQGRAGRFADAERTLVGATSGPQPRATAWMRLGEVRIAMGKLDEAIGALDTALEVCSSSCDAPLAYIELLLAAAHDRARRPGDADAHAKRASGLDRTFAVIVAPQYPLLGPDEQDYLLGLAHQYEVTAYGSGRPEYALVHFRRYLKQAPDSPWRRRAEEHLRELGAYDYPQSVEKRAGNAAIDVDAARAFVAKPMPAMRACLAKLPTTVMEVTVTRDGPRTPDSVRDRPRFRTPPAGVGVRDILELDSVGRAEIDAAVRCIQPIAEKMAMPTPKDKDTYYIAAFMVVSP